MTIHLTPITAQETALRFSVIKDALHEHIDAVFGWDDEFQRHRLNEEYDPAWFHWVHKGDNKVGLLCFKPYDNAYHIHFLIIFPHFQKQGIGQMTMEYVHQLTQAEQRQRVTLSCFVRNHGAASFYKRLGYEITQLERDFYNFSKSITTHH